MRLAAAGRWAVTIMVMKTTIPAAHATIATPLGDLLLAATSRGLCGAWFVQGQGDCPETTSWGAAASGHALLAQATCELHEYFAGQRKAFGVPLDLSVGTAFQQAVWQALCGIACGAARSYGEVATLIGRPAAVRAVGTAVGANPVSVIVPCHRVLGGDGRLTGYTGGLARKLALLRLEGWSLDMPDIAVACDASASTDKARLRALRPQPPMR